MSKKKIIIGNWKMNPLTIKEAEKLFLAIGKELPKLHKTEVVVCPPVLYIDKLKKISKKIPFGAQNAFPVDAGPFTGEISSKILYNTGIKYVIIGHSEHRAMNKGNT